MSALEVVRYSADLGGRPLTLAPPETGSAVVSGLAAVWGVLSSDRGGWRDRFRPHSLRWDDVVALVSHDPSIVLGRLSAGTLQLESTDEGLAFACELPDTQAGRDLAVSMRRGDLSTCSFAAALTREDWDYDRFLRTPVRDVLAADLLEISIVPLPAFRQTRAEVTP